MSALESKVISFGTGEVYKQIKKFLETKALKSEKTSISYKKGIQNFFEFIKGKQLEFLTREDVQITFDDLENFVTQVSKSNEYNNKTINGYISSVAELLRYLHMKKLVDDISCLSSLKMIRLPEQQNKYGVLRVDEVFDFADWVLENEVKLADVKYYFILFSLDTCLRKSAVLNLKWENFIVKENDVFVKAVDKGNSDFKGSISHEFYNELLKLKEKYNTEKVFEIGSSTIQGTLDRWKEARNIPDNRNIVLHSIRKAGANFHFRTTSDILQAKKVLGHKNTSTTEIYLDEEEYGAIGIISQNGKEIDNELYKKVSKDDLIKAIENIKGYKTLLNIELQKIIGQKLI